MADDTHRDALENWQGRWTHPAFWIATGFGSGLIRPAPGTWGSLAALFIALPRLGQDNSGQILLLMATVAFIVGVYVSNAWEKHVGTQDDGRIVIDEFAGMWIAMLPLTLPGFYTPTNLLLSFILFRLFDIWKPWPIGLLDKNVKGGLGVMIDDVVAGIFAAVGLLLLILFITVVIYGA